jgi:thioredoxin
MMMRLIVGIVAGGVIGAAMGYFGKCSSGVCPLTANPIRGAVFGVVLGALFSLSYGPGRRDGQEPGAPSGSGAGAAGGAGHSESKALVHIDNENDFRKSVLEATLPCLVDFFSKSCPPCRRLAPTISSLADKYEGKAVICKLSLDHAETTPLAQEYRITGIPAVLFFEKGKEVQRLVGLRPEAEYSRVLDGLIAESVDRSEGE